MVAGGCWGHGSQQQHGRKMDHCFLQRYFLLNMTETVVLELPGQGMLLLQRIPRSLENRNPHSHSIEYSLVLYVLNDVFHIK